MIFKGEITVQRLHINDVRKCDTTQICIDFGRILNNGGASSHPDLTDKNEEPDFLHIDTTITKNTLVNDDKVAIFDSETGKVVLTGEINKLLPLIYAGL